MIILRELELKVELVAWFVPNHTVFEAWDKLSGAEL